ncbi:ligand-binding sensor domain-containing protein [Spirosoma flavum]|uniref:Two-component regulator propeller domain-containing protein n=1 Tax=Spirosoma flavum TaxID=2048557 RepID=A0ABW6AIA4_9BACT
MTKLVPVCALLMSVFCTSCGQNQTEEKKNIINSENKGIITPYGPNRITRNIIQDRKGNIWMAAFDGIFKYDGKSFTNVISEVSSARFFSVLEDRKGNLWFGSIGSGVYCYDGRSFENFTTEEGLLNNEVTSIYEDKKGNIWFGVSGGASWYDGKSFRNYITDGNAVNEDRTGKTSPKRQLSGVGPIIEDRKGGFWFGAGGVFRYDGRSFTAFTHNGKPFKNVRSIIEDKKGNIWLGGADGLWRYDGSAITNFNQRFIGRIMEDKDGNIWTSSGKNSNLGWALSRYDGKSLSNEKPTVTIVANKPMTFGILEDDKGSIWFGSFDGVHRYDGKTITDFKRKEVKK